eukprot:scaffold3670_cov124-Cylindrotheca_fusiformis.AAC.33
MEREQQRPDMKLVWAPPQFSDKKVPLPTDFEPQPNSVRIGRGKACSGATGNRRLQVLASSFVDDYRKASTTIEKSVVVTEIVDSVREACPVGAFVRYQDSKWWEVGDFTARLKVGSILRDLLSDKYRSSSKSRSARRKKPKKDSLTTGTVSAVRSNMHPRSSNLPVRPQDHQENIAAMKEPPFHHHTLSEQGGSVPLSAESQRWNDGSGMTPPTLNARSSTPPLQLPTSVETKRTTSTTQQSSSWDLPDFDFIVDLHNFPW